MKLRGATCSMVLLATGFSACDGDSKTSLVTVDDSGSVDISTSGTGLGIRVAFDSECLSSSCDEVQMATCSASVTDNRIVVSSQLVYASATGERACTDDCGGASAECSVPVTAPGVYQLTHGACQATITLPLPPLANSSFCRAR